MRPRVGAVAPVRQAPVANNSFVLGEFAKLAQGRQPIVEYKTRLSVNANIKPVEHGIKNIATKTVSIAGNRTRRQTPLTTTGTLGKPVTATQSKLTGAGR